MTKVQIHFGIDSHLDEALMSRIADAHKIYGILRASLDPSLDGLTVEYDASRLTFEEVQAALRSAGIAVRRRTE